MARLPRIVVPEMPHHIWHRGNRKCIVFCDDIDRKTYLRMLREQCIKLSIRIWAYALMTNHIHRVAVPPLAESLSICLQNAHGAYADYFNTRHGTVGHLWQGRFKASVLDEAYLWNAVRYVERNPVRAGMVRLAEDYRWSSAAAHCGLREDPLLSNDLLMLSQIPEWSAWLRDELPVEKMKLLRTRTHTGRPCGDDDFIRNMGAKIGRVLTPSKPGPKKKECVEPETKTPLFDEIGD